jgi:hypothetical protein
MPTSFRLDRETERELARLARTTGRTKSQVIRDAIRAEAARDNGSSFYDRVSHLIGVAGGLPRNLSERTGEKVRAILKAKQRARR